MANGVGSAAGRSKRDQMPKQIRLNAFDMNCVGHQSPGLWTHPRDRSDRYNTLDYWVELAKLLERGKFDALFLADVLGVYDVYRRSPDAAIANAVQVPVNDPLLLIPAMEHDTRYEIAKEYMQIVYKLWEGSWEDGAVLRDRTQRVFARPENVHRIRHDGRYFQVEATHLCEPSPQRTPLIYQAGAS